MARPTPVLPEVGSTTVPPALNLPSASARSIIFNAIRSLMDPPGFINSHLTRMVGFTSVPMELSLTNGVLPIKSRIVSAYLGVTDVGCLSLIWSTLPSVAMLRCSICYNSPWSLLSHHIILACCYLLYTWMSLPMPHRWFEGQVIRRRLPAMV